MCFLGNKKRLKNSSGKTVILRKRNKNKKRERYCCQGSFFLYPQEKEGKS